jgi:hypothetical protein
MSVKSIRIAQLQVLVLPQQLEELAQLQVLVLPQQVIDQQQRDQAVPLQVK